jgi:N4-(beta-N-acetylglucosaminyl)-L-asparaginase
MILIANSEGWPGIAYAANMLQQKSDGLDALIAGISRVEREAKVRSVGYGGWPNLLGRMEFDAGVMNGTTREVGAVGAVPETIPVAELAREVMRQLPHVMLTGYGARRFADEMGLPREEALLEDSRTTWRERILDALSPADRSAFPDIALAPLSKKITDPERVRDTTVFLCRDSGQNLCAATSTSGWAWKYPGRLGDSPIAGAGFYADSRYGAAACTHTGEMTIRCATARTIVLALKFGRSLTDAVDLAMEELAELREGFLGPVVIHAIDAAGNHDVASFQCQDEISYWLWEEGMPQPELRPARQAFTHRENRI